MAVSFCHSPSCGGSAGKRIASGINFSDLARTADRLPHYVAGFSPDVRNIFECFRFNEQVARLRRAGLLSLLLDRFCEIDLQPESVSNHEMGYIFEELIRRFSEQSGETAGEHFTPREVIQLMVRLVFGEDSGDGKSLYDPACGTGGMLSAAEEHLRVRASGFSPGTLRPGAESGILCHLQGRRPVARARCRQHRARQQYCSMTVSPGVVSISWSRIPRSASTGEKSEKQIRRSTSAGL